MIVDEQEDPIAFLYLDTTVGRVLILFQDEERLNLVARYATDQILQPGHRIASISMEFSSIEEAAREIGRDDPTLQDADLLVDSDPLVTELVASLRQAP